MMSDEEIILDQAVLYRQYMSDAKAHQSNLSFTEWKAQQ